MISVLSLLPFISTYMSTLLSYLNLYVMMPMDIILQSTVLFVALERNFSRAVDEMLNGNCWSSFSAFVTLDAFADDIKLITILGWLELILGLAAIVSARYDLGRIGSDGSGDSLHGKGLLYLSVGCLLIDMAISSADFFIFTLDARNDFRDLSSSVYDTAFDTSGINFDPFERCVNFARIYEPLPTISTDNCLAPEIPTDSFDMGLFEALPNWLILMGSMGTSYVLCRLLLLIGVCRKRLRASENTFNVPLAPPVTGIGIEMGQMQSNSRAPTASESSVIDNPARKIENLQRVIREKDRKINELQREIRTQTHAELDLARKNNQAATRL